FCKVREWSGPFEMREGQDMAWQMLPVQVTPVLPGTVPVLRWFAAERQHPGPTHRTVDGCAVDGCALDGRAVDGHAAGID
ncbi:MAG: hypothetical protein ABIN96_07435, partial [Rubrivivax sp.]